MRIWLVGLIVLLCTPAFSQQPPAIVFDSVPDSLKLPDNLYLGEVSGIASILMATSSSFRVATPPARHMPLPRRSFSNLMPMAIICVRSAISCTRGLSRTW
jgi:hypothetical protein